MISINIYFFVNNFLRSCHWCTVSTTLMLKKFSSVHSWFSLFTPSVQSSQLTNLRSLYLKLVTICLHIFVCIQILSFNGRSLYPVCYYTSSTFYTNTTILNSTLYSSYSIAHHNKTNLWKCKNQYIHILIFKLEIVFFDEVYSNIIYILNNNKLFPYLITLLTMLCKIIHSFKNQILL